MKHTLYYIAVALVFASCAYDNPLEHNPDLTIMFQPSMYMHVAADDVESFTEEMDFAVAAWSLPRRTRWSESAATATEYFPASTARCGDGSMAFASAAGGTSARLWGFAGRVQWPSVDTTLTFMGYSPASADCVCDPVAGITCTVDVLADQTDLLYTQPCADREKNTDGGVVPLIFEHAMCRIDVRAVHCVSSDEKITIKKLIIDDVLHKGTFASLKTPQWSLDDSYTGFTLFEGSQELASKPAAVGRYIFLPPQHLATAMTIEFEYTTAMQTTIPQTLKTVLMSTELQAGRTYTYTLSVGADNVKFLQEIIKGGSIN